MTFLVDNQLPQALSRFLSKRGYASQHVLDLNMDAVDDRIIWEYAIRNNCVIVTKDEDFLGLSVQYGGNSQVVWVRLGNCRKQSLLDALAEALPQLMAALEQGHRVVELR